MRKFNPITLGLLAGTILLCGCGQAEQVASDAAGHANNAAHEAMDGAKDVIENVTSSNDGSAAEHFTAPIITNDRSEIGTLTITQLAEEVKVHVVIQSGNIAPGLHGVHFHAVADCSDDKFLNTTGHINPMGMKHGLDHPDGPDNADLPNLVANETGYVNQTMLTPRLSFNGQGEDKPALFDADGSALVVHANEDDQNTQPIGGAGGRLGCAEVK